MSQRIQHLQTFLTNKKPTSITAHKPKPRKVTRCGRPSDRLTHHQIIQAVRVAEFDVAKQGRILRWRCRQNHDPEIYYTYRYQRSDGVHVWCEACGATSHWDEIHYHADDNPQEVFTGEVHDACCVCGYEWNEGEERVKCSRCGLYFCIDCGYVGMKICAVCVDLMEKETCKWWRN